MASANGSVGGLGYLTTAYPSVSHTFIRREILALEKMGHTVDRFAIRCGTVADDAEDISEKRKTFHLLNQPRAWIAKAVLTTFMHSPLSTWRAFREAVRLSSASERGLFRHLAYLFEALAFAHEFRSRGISHIHVHFGTNAAAIAMLVDIIGDATFSMTVHGPDEFDATLGLSLGRKMTASRFTVAISSYCASQLMRWAQPCDWEKIRIVHCTVDDQWFDSTGTVEPGNNTYVAVGRLSAQKGHFLLVEALELAIKRGFSGRVVLVGDGELRDSLQRKIDSHGIADRITVTGWCSGNDVRRYIKDSRALLLPSFAEGLPMVLMEAMALQRPVIATAIAGIPELVRHGREGWLTIAGDKESFVDALMEAQDTDLEVIWRMGRAGRERVMDRHGADQQARVLSALFTERTSIQLNNRSAR